jgi:formate dehydrogenase major subunit
MQISTIVNGKRNGTALAESSMVVDVVIDGSRYAAYPEERLVDLINRVGVKLSQVCYHPQLGPLGKSAKVPGE